MSSTVVNTRYGENNINVGPLKEIPEICVDHFHDRDLLASAFFLSHAHTDHMVGLESSAFTERLNQGQGVCLYCHALTPILLGSFERYLGGGNGVQKLIQDKKLVPLDVNRPYNIEIPAQPDNFFVTVTLLPAGHCPGSVMFLFERSSLRILHTGDFRLSEKDLTSFDCLHVGSGERRKPKVIHNLYVDTTFCSKSASTFPCRKEVFQTAIGHVKEWTSLSDTNWIFIKFAAKFAHEYIFLELFKAFGKKIHVSNERKEIYSRIPNLSKVVSLDPKTPFHFCGERKCVGGASIEMKLSSLWYTTMANAATVRQTGKRVNVCYSMHSSLQEVAMTINYLKPQRVTPLVVPFRAKLSEIENALNDFCIVDFHFVKDSSFLNLETVIELDGTSAFTSQDSDEEADEDCRMEDELITSSQKSADSQQLQRTPTHEVNEFKWKFDFTPSPSRSTRTPSESSGSQKSNSQEDKNIIFGSTAHPVDNLEIAASSSSHILIMNDILTQRSKASEFQSKYSKRTKLSFSFEAERDKPS